MSLLGRIDYKNANGDWIEATDSQMVTITNLLKSRGQAGVDFQLVINAQNQAYKNIGVYLTPASNLGDWRYQPTGALDSNKNALLEFDEEAGLYIMRAEGDDTPPLEWEKFENGDLEAGTATKGRDYGSRIRIGKDFDSDDIPNTTYGNTNLIRFKLRFIPETGQELHNQENSRRWDRIFVGLEFEGEIHDGDS